MKCLEEICDQNKLDRLQNWPFSVLSGEKQRKKTECVTLISVTHYIIDIVDVLNQWTSSKPNKSFHVAQASFPWPRSGVSIHLLLANWHQSWLLRNAVLRTSVGSRRHTWAHFYTLCGCWASQNPPLWSQLIVNSTGLGAFDCSVAWQLLPRKPFFKGRLGQKKKGCWRGKRRR